MTRTALDQRIRQLTRKLLPSRKPRPRGRVLAFEQLSARINLAVTASFSAGILTVIGDELDNNIELSRDAAGTIRVNAGAVPVLGGTPTVTNTSLMQIFGLGGNDMLSLDETNGALPQANIFGGAGDDTLIGGSAADMLFGQEGNDSLLGRGGADLLFGGADNDVLTGGVGDDQVFGEAGNDRMIWNPGDDTDLNEGGTDIDTVEVNGGNGAEDFAVTANGTRVRFDRINPAPFSLDIGTSEKLVLNANGGNDTFSASGNLSPLIQITVDGGAGDDTILGSNGADVLLGGDGNDFIDGNQGNDVAIMGAGDDVFQWDPGDGSDTIEGQAGADRMLFNGANVNEKIDISANGERVRFTRDVGNIVMDLNDVEAIDFNARGGADTVTVNDLSSTDITQLNLSLESVPGSGIGDGQADTVIVNGTERKDGIDVLLDGSNVNVIGLAHSVQIAGSEGANDQLVINTLGASDFVSAATLPAGVIRLTVDGGARGDTILGSRGADTLLGGDGNDFIDGNQGDDVALMGAGDDVFQWDPGDGSDTIEGQAGTDKMLFNGANVNENIDISANGERVRFTRDVGNIVMDLNDVEAIDFNARGGADIITVNDLSGTDVTQMSLSLESAPGSGIGDGQADTVVVNGTNGDDSITLGAAGNNVMVTGLPVAVSIIASEPMDKLTVNGQAGADVINASGLASNITMLTLNGGAGADLIIGSQGNDLVNGGTGNDAALLGAGDDTFVWNPGDGSDTIEGQAGTNKMLFNGANINEHIDISANGGRVRFTRDVANVTMDLNDVESIDFHALGGSDTIVVNDLSGTDVTEVNVDLKAAGGSGDGQPDNVIVNGTSGSDVISVAGDANGASVLGLAARINVAGAEPANDRLTINALAGDDVVVASGLAASAIQLTADGGDGDDVLIGGNGNDTLLGGAGDDVLLGGPGTDVLDGGPGDNIVIQD